MCGCENKSSTCIQLPSDISPYFLVDKYFSELDTEEKRNTARINLGLNNEVGIDVAYLDAGSMNISDMISEILKVMEKVGKRFIPVVYYDDSDALIGEITDEDLDTFIGSALKLDNNITLNLDNIKGKAEIVFIKENNIWRVYSKSFVETVDPNDITSLESSVSNINSKIPSQATSSNQLADKNFVNSSISTATATFRDSYNLITDLSLPLDATPERKEDALGRTVATADNNDYAFILIPTSTLTPNQIKTVERYKYSTDNKWHFEYELNNSGFTANQWAAINSGITATDVSNYDAGLEQLENKYEKPIGGIPIGDLASPVTELLGKANTAVQPGDLSAYVSYQTQTGKTDAQKAQARTNIGAASQSALNSTNQEVAKKAEVIDLQQYVGERVPTCDYEYMKNHMPYYTYGEYPIQWGIVEETDEESNNDFYYVGRFTSNDGITFGYLSFSNKGDWGFRGGNQGFFTEDNVPEALKQAIYAYSLSKETVYDAQPATLANHPVRTVKEGGTIVFPVSHSGAIFHDTIQEMTVYDEIEGLKNKYVNVYDYIGANKTLPVIGAYSYYYNERETEYPDLNRNINVLRFAFPIDDEDGYIKEQSDDYGYFYVWYDDLFRKIHIWHSDGEYYGTYTEQDDRGSGDYRNSQDKKLPYVVLRALNIGNVSVMGSNGFTDTQKALARTNIGAASTAVATTSANGLMSSTDKTKLDNAASISALNEKADKTTVRENERVVAEALNDLESRKVDKVEGKGLSTDDFKVIELTDYLTQGAVLPTDDNLIYTYSGQVVEKKIGHNGGGDDIIAFATHRDVDAYDVNNITVIRYDKGDEDESYHFTRAYNLHNDSGGVVEELKAIFGIRTATTTTDGLMSADDKIKLGHINVASDDFVIHVNTNAIALSVGNTVLRLDETNLLKLKNLLENS